MKRLKLRTRGKARECTIVVGGRAEDAAGIAARLGAEKAVVVHSRNTAGIAGRIVQAMPDAGVRCTLLSMPDGEKDKSLATVESLLVRMHSAGLDRSSCVVACGGGVVGDVSGLAASLYMRGIPLIHVPTTLLSMVDSSIGGKNGVNLGVKNLAGAFHQPEAVVIDFSTLESLPDSEYRQGFAEIAKAGCVSSRRLVESLERDAARLVARDSAALEDAVSSAVSIKARIVEEDETELSRAGVSRMLLNFGHSVGHALEASSKMTLRHGDAVSVGMVAECRISAVMTGLSPEASEKIAGLLAGLGLPIGKTGVDAESAWMALKSDKKNRGGKLSMALLEEIGKAKVVADVPDALARRELERVC
ncbi:MAG: 3-dehydroquinate synthase [Candidatus Micrarchaeota archaeon]